jgi:hypothetical protein
MIKDKECIIADIEDYSVAYDLATKLLEQTIKGASPKLKQIVNAASELEGQFTRSDLHELLPHWGDVKTVGKWAREANRHGFFEVVEPGRKGKPYKYEFLRGIDDSPLYLMSPEELQKEFQLGQLGTIGKSAIFNLTSQNI